MEKQYLFVDEHICDICGENFEKHSLLANHIRWKHNNQDDYIIALGTFYKKKGLTGNRYLIVTTTGKYTATTGDEKSDMHTDKKHMFSKHGGKAGLIEWIVDLRSGKFPSIIKRYGSVTKGPIMAMQGKILHIYEIL